MMASEAFPGLDKIRKEVDMITKAKVGDPKTPIAACRAASDEVNQELNKAIHWHQNTAALFESASAFFARDNVALPGVSLYFKVASGLERNGYWMIMDFLVKRGAHPCFGPTAAPPKDWCMGKEVSDVTNAFINALATYKVEYDRLAMLYEIATKQNDAHAVDFLTNATRYTSEKIRCAAHHVAHLKVVEDDKHAIKAFDRRLPFELEDLACAVGTETAIPARLNMGAIHRACEHQAHAFDAPRTTCEGMLKDMLARAAFNQTA